MKSLEVYTYKKIFICSLMIPSRAMELVPLKEKERKIESDLIYDKNTRMLTIKIS